MKHCNDESCPQCRARPNFYYIDDGNQIEIDTSTEPDLDEIKIELTREIEERAKGMMEACSLSFSFDMAEAFEQAAKTFKEYGKRAAALLKRLCIARGVPASFFEEEGDEEEGDEEECHAEQRRESQRFYQGRARRPYKSRPVPALCHRIKPHPLARRTLPNARRDRRPPVP